MAMTGTGFGGTVEQPAITMTASKNNSHAALWVRWNTPKIAFCSKLISIHDLHHSCHGLNTFRLEKGDEMIGPDL
jgi:hypothetical protein